MNKTFIMWECLGRALWLYLCPSIVGHTGDGKTTPLSAGSRDTAGKLIPVQISLTDDDDRHSSSFSDALAHSHPLLTAEWAEVKAFSPTRVGEQPDCEDSWIAPIGLTGGTLFHVSTRAAIPAGVYFQLIVFRKLGNDYVSQSVVDCISNGTDTPVSKQGKLLIRSGVIRVAGYPFNTIAVANLGAMPTSYTYSNSTASIPNVSKGFMTFDSGDITNVSNPSHSPLPISFSQELCKLTIIINPTGFPNNAISNCTGVYIKQGEGSTSWRTGSLSNVVAVNINNIAALSPNTILDTAIHMVSFAGARAITVYFNTLMVGGQIASGNTEIASTQSIQLKGGRSYVLRIRLKGGPGINVLEDDISLTQNECTAQDEKDLAKLIWADGGLGSTESSNYVWTTLTNRDYYYTWYSTYTGNTSQDNIGPYSKLNVSTYGTGRRAPPRGEPTKLSRRTSRVRVNNGMWFMNSPKGLFLPLAGHTPSAYGASIGNGVVNSNLDGDYWYIEKYYRLLFRINGHIVSGVGPGAFRYSVRCMKGTKQ